MAWVQKLFKFASKNDINLFRSSVIRKIVEVYYCYYYYYHYEYFNTVIPR